MVEEDVLITGDYSKLPPAIAALLDPAVTLPAGTVFFEKRYEVAEMIKRLMLAIGLGLASLVIIPFGIAEIFDHRQTTVYSSANYWPLGFGLVCALAAWMLLSSIRTCWRLRRLQLLGQPTRRGTFLTPDFLVQAEESDTTVIPRAQFRGTDGVTVKYFHRNAEKSYRLPRSLIDALPSQLHDAIRVWACGSSR